MSVSNILKKEYEMYNKILIRYGELTLKGKNRFDFINQLARNVKNICNEIPEKQVDRMFLSYSEENISNLKYVYGISSYSPVITCENNIEQIKQTAIKLAKGYKTFKVAARRNDKKFPYKSDEINNLIGSYILQNIQGIKVDVHNPKCIIYIEIRHDQTLVFTEVIEALGGLPVATSGKVLHLMSGGIDSPVAAFELMKRGLEVCFLSFITPPQTDEKTISKIKDLITKLLPYQGRAKLFLVNYSKLMNYIALVSKQSYKITLMRRSFYRIACKIAQKNKINVLSNGENLGQVASQTLESLSAINDASDLLVLRPLLTKDKIETINIAKKLGTYDISIIKANETCELFAPKDPVTKPNIVDVKLLEEELNLLNELENDVIENCVEIIKIQK